MGWNECEIQFNMGEKIENKKFMSLSEGFWRILKTEMMDFTLMDCTG